MSSAEWVEHEQPARADVRGPYLLMRALGGFVNIVTECDGKGYR